MVDMGMREHNGVYARRIDRQWFPIAQSQLFIALKQAAIDEHALGVDLDEEFRPCHCSCAAEKPD